jgi:hypothetical protein
MVTQSGLRPQPARMAITSSLSQNDAVTSLWYSTTPTANRSDGHSAMPGRHLTAVPQGALALFCGLRYSIGTSACMQSRHRSRKNPAGDINRPRCPARRDPPRRFPMQLANDPACPVGVTAEKLAEDAANS